MCPQIFSYTFTFKIPFVKNNLKGKIYIYIFFFSNFLYLNFYIIIYFYTFLKYIKEIMIQSDKQHDACGYIF